MQGGSRWTASAPAPTVAESAADVASRVQLALNVPPLRGAGRQKRGPGSATSAIAAPPLKLVLIESAAGGTLNHLGVEVDDAATVVAATRRLSAAGLPVRPEAGTPR